MSKEAVTSGRAGCQSGRDIREAAGGQPGSLWLPGWWLAGGLIYKLLTCTLFFECAVFHNEHRFKEKDQEGLQNIFFNI